MGKKQVQKEVNNNKFHASKGLKVLIFFAVFFFLLSFMFFIVKCLVVNYSHQLQFFDIDVKNNFVSSLAISFQHLIDAFKIKETYSPKDLVYNTIGAYASCGITLITMVLFTIYIIRKKLARCWYVPLVVLFSMIPFILIASSIINYNITYQDEDTLVLGYYKVIKYLLKPESYLTRFGVDITSRSKQVVIIFGMCGTALLSPIFVIWKNAVMVKQRSLFQGPSLNTSAFEEEPSLMEEENLPVTEDAIVAETTPEPEDQLDTVEEIQIETPVEEENEAFAPSEQQDNIDNVSSDEQPTETNSNDDAAFIAGLSKQNDNGPAPVFDDKELIIGDTHDDDVDISTSGYNTYTPSETSSDDVVVGGDQLQPLDQSNAFDNAPIFPFVATSTNTEDEAPIEEDKEEAPEKEDENKQEEAPVVPPFSNNPSVTKDEIKEWIKDAMAEYQGQNVDPALIAAGAAAFGGIASAGPNANLRKGSVPVKGDGPKTNVERIPFVKRLLESDAELLKVYNELKNEILSWGVKSRVSNAGDTFRLHTKTYIRMIVAGKGIKLYMALDPKDYANSTIPVLDAGAKNLYRDFPLVFKVKSPLSVKRAKLLIQDCMEKDGLEQGKVLDVDYITPLKDMVNGQDIDDDLDYDDEK